MQFLHDLLFLAFFVASYMLATPPVNRGKMWNLHSHTFKHTLIYCKDIDLPLCFIFGCVLC